MTVACWSVVAVIAVVALLVVGRARRGTVRPVRPSAPPRADPTPQPVRSVAQWQTHELVRALTPWRRAPADVVAELDRRQNAVREVTSRLEELVKTVDARGNEWRIRAGDGAFADHEHRRTLEFLRALCEYLGQRRDTPATGTTDVLFDVLRRGYASEGLQRCLERRARTEPGLGARVLDLVPVWYQLRTDQHPPTLVGVALRCGMPESEIVGRARVDGKDGGYGSSWIGYRGADAFDPDLCEFTEFALALTGTPLEGLRIQIVRYLCEYVTRADRVVPAGHHEALRGLARHDDDRVSRQAQAALGQRY